jgi:peptide-methionine (S)-S-oxide reductase
MLPNTHSRRTVCKLLLALSMLPSAQAAEEAVVIAPPTLDNPKAAGDLRTAVLAGGCFWGVHGVYQHMKGVHKVVSGYAGGSKANAHYELVGTGTTGHAESVEITYDPAELSYGELLQVFFSVVHDPTQLNRQGPDRGTQYRSAIFYGDDAEKEIALAYIKQLDEAGNFPKPIVTKVNPLNAFYPAEEYHQDFLLRNPRYPYIVYNDLPKVENLKRVFPQFYTAEPVRITPLDAPGIG